MNESTVPPPTSVAAQKLEHAAPAITRRQLLAGTGKVALFAMVPLGCAPQANTPFADGTFWDDGSGWSA